MEFLSKECLTHCFGWLNPEQLMNCAMVCKQWYRLALSDLLWERHAVRLLEIFDDSVENNYISKKVEYQWQRRQKRMKRYNEIELDTTTGTKAWRKPNGLWSVFMRLTIHPDKYMRDGAWVYMTPMQSVVRALYFPHRNVYVENGDMYRHEFCVFVRVYDDDERVTWSRHFTEQDIDDAKSFFHPFNTILKTLRTPDVPSKYAGFY